MFPEPTAEYWALHDWLFKAYDEGMKTDGRVPKEITLTWFIGPNWREEERKIALDFAAKCPEEFAFLRQIQVDSA